MMLKDPKRPGEVSQNITDGVSQCTSGCLVQSKERDSGEFFGAKNVVLWLLSERVTGSCDNDGGLRLRNQT